MNKTSIELEIEKGDYTRGLNGVAVVKTTFWSDFSIADAFGKRAVLDTYKRAFAGWKDNIEYVTALSITLNHKIWEHFEAGRQELAKLYDKLWKETDAYILACDNAGTDKEKYKNFEREEIRYYIHATD